MTREEAITFFKDMQECTYDSIEAVNMAIKALEQEPKTGHWIWDGNKYKCSKCGHHPWRINTEEHDEVFEDLSRENAYKFCPNCGIKMRGMHNE